MIWFKKLKSRKYFSIQNSFLELLNSIYCNFLLKAATAKVSTGYFNIFCWTTIAFARIKVSYASQSTSHLCHGDDHYTCVTVTVITPVSQWRSLHLCHSDGHYTCVTVAVITPVSQWRSLHLCHGGGHYTCVTVAVITPVSRRRTSQCHGD